MRQGLGNDRLVGVALTQGAADLALIPRLDAGEARLSLEAAEQRLQALGYIDPQNALRHLQALTSGVSRRAAIQRTLLPVMLGWFADAADPDLTSSITPPEPAR